MSRQTIYILVKVFADIAFCLVALRLAFADSASIQEALVIWGECYEVLAAC